MAVFFLVMKVTGAFASYRETKKEPIRRCDAVMFFPVMKVTEAFGRESSMGSVAGRCALVGDDERRWKDVTQQYFSW